MLGWANDPAIAQSNIVTVLITEGLHDLNELVVENPHAAALHIPLPDETDMRRTSKTLAATRVSGPRGEVARCRSTRSATRLTGLSRVGARTAIALALGNERTITSAWLAEHQEGA